MIERVPGGLRLVGPLLISNAKSMLDEGRSHLRAAQGQRELVLDFSGVDETDSAALGVVFGLMRTAEASGIAMRMLNPPASMISLASLYGVSKSLPIS